MQYQAHHCLHFTRQSTKKNTNDQTAYIFRIECLSRKNKNSFSVLTVEYFGAGRGFQWGKIEQNRKRHGSLSVNGQP